MHQNSLKATEQWMPIRARSHGIFKTFFAFYPTATERELAYYVKNNALPAIEKRYIFSTLINPIMQKSEQQGVYG
ncbi:conjugal transfer protein [Lysinibacillus sp. NPDC086135]|uniref:conjugal transfer protein n=1 Tax=Lysinibacillus sp. NPDC086135 TaxID=3364130 RepID=UPI0037FC3C28